MLLTVSLLAGCRRVCYSRVVRQRARNTVSLGKPRGEWSGLWTTFGGERETIVGCNIGGTHTDFVVFDPASGHLLHEHGSAFDTLHLSKFGHKARRLGVEIVNYHLVATAATPPFVPKTWKPREQNSRKGERKAFFEDWVTVPVWDRYALAAGFEMEGPAIVEEMDSTTVILKGRRGVVEPYGNLRISET